MAEQEHNSRGKKFFKDLGIYSIGVLGSKLLTFLMIPLYTYFVEKPSDYGYFDLCLEFCLLLVPVVTLQLRDGAFRFLLETKDAHMRTKIVTFVYRTMFQSALVTILLAFVLLMFYPIRHLWLTVTLLITMSFYEVLIQVTRGLGNNKAFISGGLISSFGIGFFSVIFLVAFKMGIAGIFIANILARIVSIITIEIWMRTLSQYFKIKIDLKSISREIIKYSLPLIPVTLCGLLPPLSDRLFLSHFMGFEYSGIYAVTVRLCGIIYTLSTIFYLTWQENAIQQYNSPDRDSFFSKVFNGYIYVLALLFIGYIFIIKICFSWLIAPNYQASLNYLYPMGISWIIFAISNYFYLPYQCAKDTKSVVPAVIILAIINVTLNFILVPRLGIFGVIT
ncbi:MAG: lipopolysaccharide biosynthesis protein, partial [Muribaculaceae bacterium]|nr:lipopolysaccharide biosynthesis protein [Muribaculaceae bacterium]